MESEFPCAAIPEERAEEVTRESEDLPKWLAYLTVLTASLSIPVTLYLNGSNYLTSTSGYADGGDMYSHITEALHVKTALQRGITDFWFADLTLGYPMFLAYHPLPCLLVGSLMAVTEWLVSPLLLFRWMFVLVLSAMPFTWYAGVRKLGMSQLEASLISLTLFSVQSWRKFGLEVVAFQQYGIYTQAYGMALLPLTVGEVYQCILRKDGSSPDIALILLMLTFLSHLFFGMYVVVVTGTMLLVHWFLKYNVSHCRTQIYALPFVCAFNLHFRTLVFIFWWLIPFLANYQYIGGLPWKRESENGYQCYFLIRQLMAGEVYDHGRKFPIITLLVICGIACICLGNQHSGTYHRQHFHAWIFGTFVMTFLLLLGRTTFGVLYELIPLHGELEVIRYLNGLHFFGLLFAAIAGAKFIYYTCSLVSKVNLKRKHFIVALFLAIAPLQLNSQVNIITSHVTVTEVSASFKNFLTRLRECPLTGRVYGQKFLGTGGAWDLSFVPYITAKPGVLTYSRGYHDSLSLFYLESLQLNINTASTFPDLMRLYNIHFLISTGITFDQEFLKASQLQVHSTYGDSKILARTTTTAYNYFEFVYTPGIISGNLKKMRQVILKTLRLYSFNVLFIVNPTLKKNDHPIANIYLWSNCSSFFTTTDSRSADGNGDVKEWRINTLIVDEETFMEVVSNSYRSKSARSHVLQQAVSFIEYSAIIEIAKGTSGENIFTAEHLLLKVTYHPYWSCRYKQVTDNNQQLASAGTDTTGEEWLDTEVYHVTPNLMSIVLPSGQYHVVFRYHNPLYQKIGFVLFLLVLVTLTLQQCLRCYKQITRI